MWSWSAAAQRNHEALKNVTDMTGTMGERPSFGVPLGLGLPMCLVYSSYWGGQISVSSMPNFGTDVYLSLSTENQLEQPE